MSAETPTAPWEMSESMRGLLQNFLDDQPRIDADGIGSGFGYPSWASHAIPEAVKAGYLNAYRPVDADGKSCSGISLYMLSNRGAKALAAANAYRNPTAATLSKAKRLWEELKSNV